MNDVAADLVAWGRELAALTQNGSYYADNAFDRERYARIRRIALEMLALSTGALVEPIARLFDGEEGHATPKVDVRAIVLRDGGVLLVRERAEQRWSLPGGWADVGDSPSTAAEREVAEEAGLTVRATRLLAVFDKRLHPHPPQPFHTYKLFFACDLIAGEPTAADETDAAGFFPVDNLPPLSLERVLPEQIRRLAALAAQPGAATLFD